MATFGHFALIKFIPGQQDADGKLKPTYKKTCIVKCGVEQCCEQQLIASRSNHAHTQTLDEDDITKYRKR